MDSEGLNNVFDVAEQVLFCTEIDEKLRVTHTAGTGASSLSVINRGGAVRSAREVGFPAKPEWLPARNVAKRGFGTPQGMISFLHALAHIEFMAIHLAWDILYRFRDTPDQFIYDWLSVAHEEAMHFSLLRERLRELGSDYGELPVHGGLWGVAMATENEFIPRLALVPRCMEARGLDVTPAMIKRLKRQGDDASVAILERILHDEVGHVALGSKWYRWACDRAGVASESTYLHLLATRLPGLLRKPFNWPLRIQAGFTEFELCALEQAADDTDTELQIL